MYHSISVLEILKNKEKKLAEKNNSINENTILCIKAGLIRFNQSTTITKCYQEMAGVIKDAEEAFWYSSQSYNSLP